MFLLKDSIFLDQAFSFILYELNQSHKPPFTHPTFPNTTCINLKPAAYQFFRNSGLFYHSNYILFIYRPYPFLVLSTFYLVPIKTYSKYIAAYISDKAFQTLVSFHVKIRGVRTICRFQLVTTFFSALRQENSSNFK